MMTDKLSSGLVPAAMTIAGSDSGGGAGVQVDLRTFAYFRVFGTSAITAITAQNPLEVTAIAPISADCVAKQIQTVRKEIHIAAIKTGMLFSREIIEQVAHSLADFTGDLVVDPVMISTSGKRLLQADAAETMQNQLLSKATWLTPNIPEAEVLAGMPIHTEADALKAAQICADRWQCGIVMKGGHSQGDQATDIIIKGNTRLVLSVPRIPVQKNTDHGTGCTFSAALTALLARGIPWQRALVQAKAFVLASLQESVPLSDSGLRGMYPPVKNLETYIQQIVCREIQA